MIDPVILDFIKKTFYISGYTLLYLIAMFAAGAVGRASAYVAEKWILARFIPEKLKANRDYVEVSTELCVLLCSTGFLIVAVGLLFMHLVGGLPHEYDELATQIGIAFFGLIVFSVLCLAALFVGFCIWSVGEKCRGLWNEKIVDEETGLLKKPPSFTNYGSSENVERQNARPPKRVQRTWIKMKRLSSIRDLDVQWMGGYP